MTSATITNTYTAWRDGALPPIRPDVPEVRAQILNAGICPANRNKILRGAKSAMLDVPAMFALIRHPAKGIILYDTGYATHFYGATMRFPFSIMRHITPVTVLPEENAAEQLRLDGIEPDDVAMIILSHCHVDHAAGLRDFPQARIVVEAGEWRAANRPGPLKAVTRGYLKELYQGIEPDRVETVDLAGQGKPYGVFDRAADLFGDGSLILVLLDGHSTGNMGLIVNRPASEERPDGERLFMIGDAAWLRENYLEARPAGRLAGMIIHDSARMMANLLQIRAVAMRHPEVTIVPAHSIRAWKEVQDSPFRWPHPGRKGRAGWI